MLYLTEFSVVNSAVGMMSSTLLAQQGRSQTINESSFLFLSFLIFSGYLIMGFLYYKIYQKLNVENSWFAWIPILGTYITFKAADEQEPLLWTILSFIPCISIIASIKLIIAWVRIFNKLNKSPWLLLICIIPLAAFFVFGYVAFT
ncbi:MAG: hypothetical protein F6K54_27775 [Okeania sp. SIO3B5]|uniref:DUF5684 domain-containing protein n=1 Tax=Okeania sp. SIO3B5 TaxID=2607811 RepID=UPI0013FEE862|nr:DUF5684 domain-containing protein [Okeania sp. SIO3B5]NEO56543.1 hypothetical protein [Okeania sp. SIO3B5]